MALNQLFFTYKLYTIIPPQLYGETNSWNNNSILGGR